MPYGLTQCYLPRFNPPPKHVLNLATPEGCKAELTYVMWKQTGWELNPQPVNHKSNTLLLSHHATQWYSALAYKTTYVIPESDNILKLLNSDWVRLFGLRLWLDLITSLVWSLRIVWISCDGFRLRSRTSLSNLTALTPWTWNSSNKPLPQCYLLWMLPMAVDRSSSGRPYVDIIKLN